MRYLAVVMLLTPFTFSCAVTQNRSWASTAPPACTPPGIPTGQQWVEWIPGTDVKMATIEFDEYGLLWDDEQLASALELVRLANDTAKERGAVVLAFVHGWKHNALSGNRCTFMHDLVAPFAADESLRTGGEPRPIVAVYFAWRGHLIRGPLDYYNRDRAAQHVASGDVSEAFLSILRTAKLNKETRSIVFGHSMGGLIGERSLLPAIESWLQNDHALRRIAPDREYPFASLTDLVILINPAAPAVEIRRFKLMLDRWKFDMHKVKKSKFGSANVATLLINLTSEGDWATSSVMHGAHTLATRRANFGHGGGGSRSVTADQERELVRYAAGFTDPLLTHVFKWDQIANPGRIPPDPDPAILVETCPLLKKAATVSSLGWKQRWGAVVSRPLPEHIGDASELCFVVGFDEFRLLTIKEDDPIWVVRLPRGVIPDHSRIFTPQMNHLIRGLIAVTGAAAPSPTEAQRADGIEQETMYGESTPTVATMQAPSKCTPPRDLGIAYRTATCSGGTYASPSGECTPDQQITFEVLPQLAAEDRCLQFTWQFADRSMEGAMVTREVSGARWAVLKATDDVGFSRTAAVRLDGTPLTKDLGPAPDPPEVQIVCPDDRCEAERELEFIAKNAVEGDIIEWNFGGSSVVSPTDVPASRHSRAVGLRVLHIFATGGTHHVKVERRTQTGSNKTVKEVVLPARIEPVTIQYSGEGCIEGKGCPETAEIELRVEPSFPQGAIQWRLPDRNIPPPAKVMMTAPGPLEVSVAVTQPEGEATARVSIPLLSSGVVPEPVNEDELMIDAASCEIIFDGIGCTRNSCPPATTIVFTLRCADTAPAATRWAFDDGMVATGRTVTHRFATQGTHEVLAMLDGTRPILRRVIVASPQKDHCNCPKDPQKRRKTMRKQ